MSKSGSWDALTIGVLSVLLGIMGALFGAIFQFFFVAVVVFLIFRYSARFSSLEEKLAQLESRLPRETA